MKLSIIVPVYNVADYLPKCLDSLLAQDFPQNEYEIIVVNDGSTDNSGEIAQQYADKYANITLVNQANQGLSGARNTGIKQAKGDYIQFVDSDDYLEENVLGGLMKQVEDDDLDVLRFNYENVNENSEIINPNKDPKHFVDFSNEVVDGLTFLNNKLGPACYAVQFIIKKELLIDNDIIFKSGIYFEDVEWTPRMLLKVGRVASTGAVVYYYLVREGSITKAVNKDKQRKVLEDKILLIQSMKEQYCQNTNAIWYLSMIAGTVLSTIGYIATNFYDEHSAYLSKIKELKVYPLSYTQSTPSVKRKLQLINFSSSLYCWLIHIKSNRK